MFLCWQTCLCLDTCLNTCFREKDLQRHRLYMTTPPRVCVMHREHAMHCVGNSSHYFCNWFHLEYQMEM